MGCTEKVSEELSAPATDASSTPPVETLDFELQNTKSKNLSYLLHQAGDSTSECKLSYLTAPSANDYDKTDTNSAIDCILDVEESDLFYQGIDLKLNASEGMCEYVRVKPFSYWNFQPGVTNRVLYQFSCEDNSCSSTLCGNTFKSFTDNGAAPGIYDEGDTFSNPTDASSPINFCYFNHKTKINRYGDDVTHAPNCDEGSVKIIKIKISGTNADDNCNFTTSVDPQSGEWPIESIETTECGGQFRACIAGPGEDFDTDFLTHTGRVHYNDGLGPMEKEFNIESPESRGLHSNRILANYTRSIATALNGTSEVYFSPGHLNNADHTFIGLHNVFSSTGFAGYTIETFSRGRGLPVFDPVYSSLYPAPMGHQITDGTSGTFLSSYAINGIDFEGDDQVDAYALATGPFRGVSNLVTPYYQFACLDKAFDIRAQIRLFVREWDRQFEHSNSAAINVISDVFQNATSALMDNNETPALDDFEVWNDIYDWDDFFLAPYGIHPDANGYYVIQAPVIDGSPGLYLENSYNVRVNPAAGVTFDYTGDVSAQNRMDDTGNEMYSPYDWRNFPTEVPEGP